MKALLALVALVCALAFAVPAPAQVLNIPVESRIRPIDTATLFHEFFADFFHESDGTTYVQTGDIPAMWLRDSAAQTMPYIRFVSTYPQLHRVFFGVIQRDAKNILADPYAEAFSAELSRLGRQVGDRFAGLARAAGLRLLREHAGSFDLHADASRRAAQDRRARCGASSATPPVATYRWPQPVPSHSGYNPYTGMIWDAFRPSDDPVVYHYNVPQNAIAVVAMRLVTAFARDAFRDGQLAQSATTLASQVQGGIQRYGRVFSRRHGGWMYAYETDGYGRSKLMDDANIPNLTALPYIGWCATNDPVYLTTRRFTLSVDDPYYYAGRYATGLGSPHTPRGWVWPLGIIGAALTATTQAVGRKRDRDAGRERHAQRADARVDRSQRPAAVYAPGVRLGQCVLGRPLISHGRRVFGDAAGIVQHDGPG